MGGETDMTPAASGRLASRVRALIRHLSEGLIEKEQPIALGLLAALAGEHIVLLGPPGTAKSEVARRLSYAFRDGEYFAITLNAFTTPEEIFGPVSIKALEADRFTRKTEHYLPTASLAFIDEIFKASGPLLNTLLGILNERVFVNGTERVRVPLISVVGASNELPDEAELGALYDRFLLRYVVNPVSDKEFGALLNLGGSDWVPPPTELRISTEELAAIREAASRVVLSDEALSTLAGARSELKAAGIEVSDRRWVRLRGLLQVVAHVSGRQTVLPGDCLFAAHCLWSRTEQERAVGKALGKHFDPQPLREVLATMARLASQTQEILQAEQAVIEPAMAAGGIRLHVDPNGCPTAQPKSVVRAMGPAGEPLFLAPPGTLNRGNHGRGYTAAQLTAAYGQAPPQRPALLAYLQTPASFLVREVANLPLFEPKHYPDAHVLRRTEDAARTAASIEKLADELATFIRGLDEFAADNPWPGLEGLGKLVHRFGKLRSGALALWGQFVALRDAFALLPRLSQRGHAARRVQLEQRVINGQVQSIAVLR